MLCTTNIFETIYIFGNIDNNYVGTIETFGDTKAWKSLQKILFWSGDDINAMFWQLGSWIGINKGLRVIFLGI